MWMGREFVGLQTVDADLPTDKIRPSLDEVREVVEKRHLASLDSVLSFSELEVKKLPLGYIPS